MATSNRLPLTRRDLAILRAIGTGRCEFSEAIGMPLLVDGLLCCDQFVGARLFRAGLITATGPPGVAILTASGQAMLDAC